MSPTSEEISSMYNRTRAANSDEIKKVYNIQVFNMHGS